MLITIINIIKKIWEKSASSLLGLFIFLLYSIGFVIWNQRLIPFGFFEYNLLQTRFIAAGFIYIFILFLIILLIDAILYRLGFSQIKTSFVVIIILSLGLILFYLFKFPKIFIYTPQWLGGGRPIPTTILGTEEQIEYLAGLGVQTVENSNKKPVQTGQICLIYQNDSYIVFQTANENGARNILLSRERFIGFSSVHPFLSKIGCKTF